MNREHFYKNKLLLLNESFLHFHHCGPVTSASEMLKQMRAGAAAKKPAKVTQPTPAKNSNAKANLVPNQQSKPKSNQTSKPANQSVSAQKIKPPPKTTSAAPKITTKPLVSTQTQTHAPKFTKPNNIQKPFLRPNLSISNLQQPAKPTISKHVALYPTYDLKPNNRQSFFMSINQRSLHVTPRPKTPQINTLKAARTPILNFTSQLKITQKSSPVPTTKPFLKYVVIQSQTANSKTSSSSPNPKPTGTPPAPAKPITLATFLSAVAGDSARDLPAIRQTTPDTSKPPTTTLSAKPSKAQLLTTRNLATFYRAFFKNPEHPQTKTLIINLQQTNQAPTKIIADHPLLCSLLISIGEKNTQSLAASLQQIFRSENFTQLEATVGRSAAIKISFAMHALSALVNLGPTKITNGYLIIGGSRISIAFLSRLNTPQNIFSFIYTSTAKASVPQQIQNVFYAGPPPISPYAFALLTQNASSTLDIFTILFAGAFYLSTIEEEKEKKRKKLENLEKYALKS